MSAPQSFASEIFPVQKIVVVGTAWLDFCMENAVCFLNYRDLSRQHRPGGVLHQGSKGRQSNESKVGEMR